MKRALKILGWSIGVPLLLIAATLGALKLTWTLDPRAPEPATARRDIATVSAPAAMVVAAHPLATKAGVDILKAGGNAMDAAVAVQMVLNLVEPQSSGIGGGAFLLHYDHGSKKLRGYDGRETAPAATRPDVFLHADGKPFDFVEAMVGGRSVGTPGVLRALELAHRQHGRLPWQRLFEPAIRLAENGFEITPRFHALSHGSPLLRMQPTTRGYFYDEDGRALAVGTQLKNPALAQTLRRIADGGADAFYRGPIAAHIATAVREAVQPKPWKAWLNFSLLKLGAPRGFDFTAEVAAPGSLSEADLATYHAVERTPLCVRYKTWRVCGFGPPSSALNVLQIVKLLERFDLGKNSAVASPEALHLLTQAERLAYADRDRYVADPGFVTVPTAGLLDADYLAARSALISADKDSGRVVAGVPPGLGAPRAEAASPELPATSHFSIVDAQRNVVAMTTSIEYAYGSHLMVDGFLLNNQLTDFSFDPGPAAAPVANALAPGKRPRSSMSPLIVFDAASGEPVLALGSPGGSRILGYVARALLAQLGWGLDPQAAMALPHVVNRNGATEIENEGWAAGAREALASELQKRGHTVEVLEMNSGLHAIRITPQGLIGGADPRREGLASGY